MDELRELQAAIRSYFSLEHKANDMLDSALSDASTHAAETERKLHLARRKVLRLAGIDETD